MMSGVGQRRRQDAWLGRVGPQQTCGTLLSFLGLSPTSLIRRARISNFVKFGAALLVTAMCFWVAPEACASDPWQPISPDELKMTVEPKAPGAPAIYLYRQVDRDDDTGHREFDYMRIKILTEEGRKYADVNIPFVKEDQKVRNIKARTIQPDGTAAEFTGKIYEKTIVKAKGVKVLAKTFTLPEVHVGTLLTTPIRWN